jgi:hypothetical protein
MRPGPTFSAFNTDGGGAGYYPGPTVAVARYLKPVLMLAPLTISCRLLANTRLSLILMGFSITFVLEPYLDRFWATRAWED